MEINSRALTQTWRESQKINKNHYLKERTQGPEGNKTSLNHVNTLKIQKTYNFKTLLSTRTYSLFGDIITQQRIISGNFRGHHLTFVSIVKYFVGTNRAANQ